MAANPQTQANFIAQLPYDIREAIYKELWSSWAPRQHVTWHIDSDDVSETHLCREPCITEFQVADQLQAEIEALRLEGNVPQDEPLDNATYRKRLESCWLNHWKCGERLDEMVGEKVNFYFSTSIGQCWCDKKEAKQTGDHGGVAHNVYLPMLLSCKLISEECLRYLYQSTTFIFTDMMALQTFVGACQRPHLSSVYKNLTTFTPRAFRKYALRFEVSLFLDFQLHLMCSVVNENWNSYNEMFKYTRNPDDLELVQNTDPHDPFDFHWLHLDSFENLQSVKIWIAGRREGGTFSVVQAGTTLNQIEVNALTKTLSSVSKSNLMVLSTPLDEDVEPEDGYVRGTAEHEDIQIWRRGAGDWFHPGPRGDDNFSENSIVTSVKRRVCYGEGEE